MQPNSRKSQQGTDHVNDGFNAKNLHSLKKVPLEKARVPAEEKDSYIQELLERNEEIQNSRRAALDALEDAMISKDALEKSEKVLKELNESLEKKVEGLSKEISIKNRQLESLYNEIQTFNLIAANVYDETLKHLYTNLEYIASHDANNLSNTGRANIRRAQAAIQKMKLLTEDIVSYTNLTELKKDKQKVDLEEIVNNVLENLKRIEQSNSKIDHEKLPVVDGYSALTSMLFKNLLENAIKFRKEDQLAKINVDCKMIKGEEIGNDQADKSKNYFCISVRDNGLGFPSSEKEKVFEIFTRLHDKTKYRGSGIGLAICKKIMEMHDGFITVESESGKGSSFHCYFPSNHS